ncbi:MAG: hypothetical protein M9892_07530 [Bacteroidetes bacterium]|nr:hypothetical protein [Bacteroidota bacterium]
MITIRLSTRTKAGKTILELVRLLSATDKNIEIIEGDKEKSPYDPKFVTKIKKAELSKNRTRVSSKNLWQSI